MKKRTPIPSDINFGEPGSDQDLAGHITLALTDPTRLNVLPHIVPELRIRLSVALKPYVGQTITSKMRQAMFMETWRKIRAYRNKGVTIEFRDCDGRTFDIVWPT